MSYKLNNVVDVENKITRIPPEKRKFGFPIFLINQDVPQGKGRISQFTSTSDLINDLGSNSPAINPARSYFNNNEFGRPQLFWTAYLPESVASPATLTTPDLTNNLSSLLKVSNGSITFVINGTDVDLTSLDFTTSNTLEDILNIIKTSAGNNLNSKILNNRFEFSTTQTGATQKIGVKESSTGTDLIANNLLNIANFSAGNFTTIDLSANVNNFKAITDGSISLKIDGGSVENFTSLDFSTITTIGDIANVFNTAISSSNIIAKNNKLIFESLTSGPNSSVEILGNSTGTDLSTSTLLDITKGVATAGSVNYFAVKKDGTDSSNSFEEILVKEILEKNNNYYTIIPDISYSDTEKDILAKTIEDYKVDKDYLLLIDLYGASFYDPAKDVYTNKFKDYDNVVGCYNDNINEYMSSGIASILSNVDYTILKPAINIANKSLKDLTPISLESNNYNTLVERNINFYTKLSKIETDVIEKGVVFSGYPIDVIQASHSIKYDLEFDILNLLNTTEKLPFTREGFNLIEAVINKKLSNYFNAGVLGDGFSENLGVFLPTGYKVIMPDITTYDIPKKVNRILEGINVVMLFSGAIEVVKVINNIEL